MQDEPEIIEVPESNAHNRSHGWRVAFLILMAGAGACGFGLGAHPLFELLYRYYNRYYRIQVEASPIWLAVAASAILGLIVGASLGNLVLRYIEWIGAKREKMDSGDKITLFISFFVSIVVSPIFLVAASGNGNIIPTAYQPFLLAALLIGLFTICIYGLQSMSDVLPWTKGKARGKRTGTKLLDTNVIIDGRIYDVARTGFLEGNLYVPGFVLDELQYIADSHDALRRQRGRRGLDVLRHMQSDFQLEVRSQDRLAPDTGDGVDSRLVRLARAMGADIVTNDFNLNRVAALQEVKVLNINDLALGLRPNVLPSESLTITLVREGNQPLQGIGYLEDGTMVVVEGGKARMGETLDVTVSQVIQTERGKMIFAELPNGETPEPNTNDYPRRPRTSTRRM
jgi:uncharacterized protein YacL